MSEETEWDDPDALSEDGEDTAEFGGVIVLGLALIIFAYLVFGQSLVLARLALGIAGGLVALTVIAGTILAWGRR